MIKGNGKVVIISSPSGGGKTTICHELLRRNSMWEFSISFTTRPKRRGETDGKEYRFVNRHEFFALRNNEFFVETARVHGHYYGTPRGPLEEAIRTGSTILLDVDVKGAASIRKSHPRALSLFILPPSEAELKRRLKRRGTETSEQLQIRLQNAIAEMDKFNRFDYVIINKDINEAVAAADHMIKSWTVGVTYFGRNKSRAYQVNR
jgi:guanylate kinase